MTDLYGQDLMRLVQDLVRRVEKLEAAATSGRGLKIGRASGPFNIPSASSPDSPDDGASIYFDGGFRYVDSSGNDKPIGADPAADVGGMSGLSTPNSWPSTYNPATGGLVQDDLDMIRLWVLQLRTNLRAANLMA